MPAARTMLVVDDARLARMMIRGFVSHPYPDWTILEAQEADIGCIPKPITEDKILTVLAHLEQDHA